MSEFIFDKEILPSGYSIWRKDRTSRGGGVLAATACHLSAHLLSSPSDLEVLTLQLFSHNPIVICVVYISPSSTETYWISLLDYLRSLIHSDAPTFIVGDFNCPDIDWQMLSASSRISSLLCEFVFDMHLTQVVDRPTHVRGNILDLIISNSADRIFNVHVNDCQFLSSDHFPISFSIKVIFPRSFSTHRSTFLDYSKADFEGMSNFLFDWDFGPCFDSSDVGEIWSSLKLAIRTAVAKFVPSVTCPRGHSALPKWFDKNLRHDLKCLRTLRRRCKSHPTAYLFRKLADSESRLRTNISLAKTSYESRLVSDSAFGKSSKIYKHIRSVLQQDQLPSKMFFESCPADTDKDKANLFNKYFFTVYSSETTSPSLVSALPQPSSTLSELELSPLEVYDALAGLDPSKAMGIDGIGPKVLKSCACALYEPIHHMFQVSLKCSQLPSEWLIHCITPIFKSGDRSQISRYRPISLLCSISKLLERLIYDKIVAFLTQSLSDCQFGFLQGKSTLQQLLVFLHSVDNDLSRKLQTDVIYLDFRKAFDSVSHNKLLDKLWSLGITGSLWLWFRAYLSSRSQTVYINGHYSDYLPVTSGVPQGSILGPLLFLVYINNIPSLAKSARLLLFADDTKCVKTISKFSDCTNLQNDLNSLYNWSLSNIAFNREKSVLLRFSTRRCHITADYFMDNQQIVSKEHHRDLGVIISNDLSWSVHYSLIVSKAYRMLGLLRRTFSSLNSIKTRRALYLTMVRSQLTYCSTIWRPHLLKDIVLLETVQRRATKWILNDYNSDYKTRLIALHLLPLMMVYEVNDLSFCLKSLQSPSLSFNILDYISFSSSSTRSFGKKLRHHFPHTNKSRHFYFSRLPRLWNSLPFVDLNCSFSQTIMYLKTYFWSHFITHFDSSNPCSFHYQCPCNKCISS